MNAIEAGYAPDSMTQEEIALAIKPRPRCPLCNNQGKVGGCRCGRWADHDTVTRILDSLAEWRKANPHKRWPPRQVQINGTPGLIMSRFAGCAQIATGVRDDDGGPDWNWYRRHEFELA